MDHARQRYYQKKGIFLPLLLHDMLNTERPSPFLYLLNPQNSRGHVLAACPFNSRFMDTSMKLVTWSGIGLSLLIRVRSARVSILVCPEPAHVRKKERKKKGFDWSQKQMWNKNKIRSFFFDLNTFNIGLDSDSERTWMICTSRPEPYCFDSWLGPDSIYGSWERWRIGWCSASRCRSTCIVHTAQRSLEPKVLVADIFFSFFSSNRPPGNPFLRPKQGLVKISKSRALEFF